MRFGKIFNQPKKLTIKTLLDPRGSSGWRWKKDSGCEKFLCWIFSLLDGIIPQKKAIPYITYNGKILASRLFTMKIASNNTHSRLIKVTCHFRPLSDPRKICVNERSREFDRNNNLLSSIRTIFWFHVKSYIVDQNFVTTCNTTCNVFFFFFIINWTDHRRIVQIVN